MSYVQPLGNAANFDFTGLAYTPPASGAVNFAFEFVPPAGQYLSFDGLDDGMSTGAITLGSDMDCYIVLRRKSSKKFVLMYNTPTWVAVGVGQDTDVAPATSTGGTYAVNGVVVPGGVATTRDQLHTAIPVGEWVVVELRNNNLSAFPSVGFGGYSYGYQLDGDIAGIILCPAGSESVRRKNRQWLGNKVGLTLS